MRTLGARLRRQRIARGWSLEEASTRCGVGRDFLGALERHDLSALTTIGYGLGYVRAYARVLGLDAKQCVADFKHDSADAYEFDRPDQPHFVPKRRVRLPRGTVPALSVVAAVVMLGTWYGVQLETVASPGVAVATYDPDQVEAAAPTPDNILTVRTTSSRRLIQLGEVVRTAGRQPRVRHGRDMAGGSRTKLYLGCARCGRG